MPLEPLQIPMLWGRIAIAIAALAHGLFATFIVGLALISAGVATADYISGGERYGRLVHRLAFILILTTGTISFMGVTLLFSLNIFWPRFWSALFRIMFWPLLLEAGFFLGEAVFAYAWYYGWSWKGQKGIRGGLHLSFVWLASGFSLAAMFMIDMVASYMLTPAPPGALWEKLFNPTMLRLDVHRFFGNLVWAGFALAGLSAIGALRAKNDNDRDHFQWSGRLFFSIGFGALLVMPYLGFLYLRRIRYTEPQVFYTLMLGERSSLFAAVALLYGLLVVVGSAYIYHISRRSGRAPLSLQSFMPLSLAAVLIAATVFALPYHLQHIPFARLITDRAINPFGKMQPNKYLAMSFLVVFGFFNWIYYFRSLPAEASSGERKDRPERRASFLLLTLAVLSIFIYLAMGWARETARAANGYLIYNTISLSDEADHYSAAPKPP